MGVFIEFYELGFLENCKKKENFQDGQSFLL